MIPPRLPEFPRGETNHNPTIMRPIVTDDTFAVTEEDTWVGRSSTDEAVAREVSRMLRGTGRTPLRDVVVCIDRGVVTLRGRVPTYYLKQLAQQAAMSVPGVDRLHNQLIVE